jgi:hypothetical protein
MFAVYVPSSELATLTIFTVKMNARARGLQEERVETLSVGCDGGAD